MDGLKFYKAVKKEESLQNTPFLMVTVADSKERAVEALKLGIRDYIVKPLSSKSFEGKVKSLLKIEFLYKRIDIFLVESKNYYIKPPSLHDWFLAYYQ